MIDDERIYRSITLCNSMKDKNGNTFLIKPYSETQAHGFEFYETVTDVRVELGEKLEAIKDSGDKELEEKLKKEANERIAALNDFYANNAKNYQSAWSMIHPYALIKLAGSVEGDKTYLMDKKGERKWYETDGIDGTAGYSKNPTTSSIIEWGMGDWLGRFPYSFQDFAFCKYWNKIQNNRMITLRRYAAPVTDNVIPANYDNKGNLQDKPFSPLATAVTYFGAETGNDIKDLLSFTVGYEWDEAKGDVWNLTSNQNEAGDNLMGNGVSWLNTGVGMLSQMLGIFGDLTGESRIDSTAAMGLPPDPYAGGAYENRIIGPVNVIDSVKKRKRGLVFNQEGLKVTFEYVARPIAGVNNKAIMLDLLSNILVMTSSSGMFFGGVQRYRNQSPAIYPWRGQDSLNKLYNGQLLGKDGAFMGILGTALEKTKDLYSSFLQDFIDSAAKTAKSIVNSVKNFVNGGNGGGNGEVKENAKETMEEGSKVLKASKNTLNRVVTAKVMKGANVPWLDSMHALLTGAPVGDWHLVIGNPLNPIAMIGNLIVKDCNITFSEELGPDDFPIGFKAVVTLQHGMGRDRDAVESMFNRGNGRIYILSDTMKSSADSETTVDNYTGVNNTDSRFPIQLDGRAGWIVSSGSDYIYGQGISDLSNHGNDINFFRNKFAMNGSALRAIRDREIGQKKEHAFIDYPVAPWTTRYTL